MYLDALAPSWRTLHQQLVSQVRVLVVDNEPAAQAMFRNVLAEAGIRAETATSAEQALEMLESESYDLVLTDNNLPGASGLDLLTALGARTDSIPAIMISSDADIESITEAFERGAADYVPKPLREAAHLLSRVKALLDRRITSRLFDVMIHDLRAMTRSLDSDEDTHLEIAQRLEVHRAELEARTAVLICDDSEVEAAALVRFLEADGIVTERADNRDAITEIVERGPPPLVAVVALELPGALSLIEHMHSVDSQIEILVTAETSHVDQALGVVRAGAADFAILAAEGPAPLVARVRRLLSRANRHARYLHLAATLGEIAARENPELATAFAIGSTVFERESGAGTAPALASQPPPPSAADPGDPGDEGVVTELVADNAWDSKL